LSCGNADGGSEGEGKDELREESGGEKGEREIGDEPIRDVSSGMMVSCNILTILFMTVFRRSYLISYAGAHINPSNDPLQKSLIRFDDIDFCNGVIEI
jgi:hypothetical protein